MVGGKILHLHPGRCAMLYTLTTLVIGIIIGWNLPQPPWARDLQERIVNFVKAMLGKTGR